MDLRTVIDNTWGHLPRFRWKSNREACSACPQCGGDDRFWMNEFNGVIAGHCRKCDHVSYPDRDDGRFTEEEMRAIAEESARRRRIEQMEFEGKLDQFQQHKGWQQYHKSMNDTHRKLWLKEGISYEMQDKYELGFHPNKGVWRDGKEYLFNALTIPAWHYENTVNTIQFRLIGVPSSIGKYWNMKGFPVSLFFARPDMPIKDRVIVVEGAKKAIVVQNALDAVKYEANVVAFPSKNPGIALINEVAAAEEVILALDPDADEAEKGQDSELMRIIKAMHDTTIKVARFPVKPDDLIVKYGYSFSTLARYIRLSRYARVAA